MSTAAAPKRWLDALPEGEALRGSLQAARRDLPTPESLEYVYGHVIAVAGGAGGGGVEAGGSGVDPATTTGDLATGATASGGATSIAAASRVAGGKVLTHAASGVFAKGLVVGLFGVASVGTAYWIARDAEHSVVETTQPHPVVAPAAPRAAETAPLPASPAPAPTVAARAAPPAASAGELDRDPEEEMALLREASGSILSNPGRALALVEEAERRFARGALAQEREVIRVQALIAAGRRDEALQRARALLARTPTSAHRPRLEQLLPELSQ